MKLATLVSSISASQTMALKSRAAKMKKEGLDVIEFGAGEPDFDTPDFVKQAAITAINNGFTKYTPVGGTIELREWIVKKFKRENNLDYKVSEVMASCGAKHVLFNMCLALFEKGDEVILPAPYWVTYPEQIKLAGASVRIVHAKEEDSFVIKPDVIESAINKNTKAIIVNTPSNPTGAVLDKGTLEAIAKLAIDNDLILISDECYERILYDNKIHYSIAGFSSAVKERTITVNAVSKTFSMTGWRLGYVAAPENVIAAMTKIQGQSTSNPCSISQMAAIAALGGNEAIIEERRVAFQKRRNYIVDRFNNMEGFSCFMPSGAFYCFPNCSKLFGRSFNGIPINDSKSFCEYMLDQAHVAIVAGSAFGAEGFLRISYALSEEKIKSGLDRLEMAINKLK